MVKVTKTNKSIILIFSLVLSLLFVFSVNAITATLLTGVIQVNVEETPVVLEKSLGVRNDNNFTVNVVLEPGEDIIDIIDLETYNITLEPFEDRFVKFNLTINKNKNYDSKITAIFSKINTNPEDTEEKVGMDMGIRILQKNPTVEPTENNSNLIFLFSAIAIIAIAAITLIILKLTRWKR